MSREKNQGRGRRPFNHPVQGVLIAMGAVVLFLVFLVVIATITWWIA